MSKSHQYIIEEYTPKSIAVFIDDGVTKYDSALLALDSTPNKFLRGPNDTKRTGWVFPKFKRSAVIAALEGVDGGSVNAPAATATSSASAGSVGGSGASSSCVGAAGFTGGVDVVQLQSLVRNLSSRLEAVESEVTALRKLVTSGAASSATASSATASSGGKTVTVADMDDDMPEEDDTPFTKSLIRRKK